MSKAKIDLTKKETNKFNETYLIDVNGTTFQNTPSEILFKKFFSALKDNYLLINIGTDSGLLVDYIDKTTHDKNVTHIFIDYSDVIEYVNQNYEYDKTKIKLFSFDDDFETIEEFIKQNNPAFYITAEIYLSKALCVIDSNIDYNEKFTQILEEFNSFMAKRGYTFFDEIFTNTNITVQAFLDNSLATLEKSIENIPALVLGGGPTLDENIEWIKHNQSKFIIVTVARISHRLMNEGIIPDAIVTIDPTELSYSNSKEALSLSDKSLLVCSNHPNYKLAGQWQGRLIYMGKRLAIPSVNNPSFIAQRGNTVSNFAAQFAMVIGSRDIYLSGVDFCYLASGQSHEGKSLESQTGISGDISTQTENYAGEKVGTTPNFELAKLNFDHMIKDFKVVFEGLNVYALSNKTAKMEHVQFISTDKIDVSLYDSNNKDVFHKTVDNKLLTEDKDLLKDLGKRKSEVQNLIKKLTKAKKHIDKKMALLDPEWTDLDFINLQLEKIVNKVEDILSKPLLEYIKEYGLSNLIVSLKENPKSAIENKNLLELDRISYLNLVNKTITDLLKPLQTSEKFINIRTSEIKQKSDPETIIKYWIKNNLPGRILIWKNQFSEFFDKLRHKNPELLQLAITSYEAQFESSQSVKKQLEQKAKDVSYFLKTINEYKAQGSSELLSGLKEQILKAKTSSAQELIYYLEACIYSIKERPKQAIEQINHIEQKGIIHFNALQLKLSLSMALQEHQVTLETFLQLCEYSQNYMPKYAVFLNAIGNKAAAIEILKMYLSLEPNDTESIIKLYNFISEVNQEEANQWLAQKRQELPDNKTLENLINSIV